MRVSYFVNRAAGKRYKMVSFDQTVNPPVLTLKGEYTEFTEVFDKERFKALGYELVQENEPDEPATEDAGN